jgi:hypothetical protein
MMFLDQEAVRKVAVTAGSGIPRMLGLKSCTLDMSYYFRIDPDVWQMLPKAGLAWSYTDLGLPPR